MASRAQTLVNAVNCVALGFKRRFPGFTHWEAHGEWKGEREESHVVQIVHPPGHEADVAAIIDAYKKRFAQEAVLQVRSDVWLRMR